MVEQEGRTKEEGPESVDKEHLEGEERVKKKVAKKEAVIKRIKDMLVSLESQYDLAH